MRKRPLGFAVLAALALAAGTAATLLSSRRIAGPADPPPDAGPRPAPGRTAEARAADPSRATAAPPLRQGPDDDRVVAVLPPALPRGNAVLLVTARRADTGKPADGALVRVTQPGPDREARTDGEGFVRIDRLLPTHALVRVSEPGRRAPARPVTLADDSQTGVEVELLPEVLVTGRVVSDADGSPVPGARLRLQIDPLADSGPWRGMVPDTVQAAAGPDGAFRMNGGLPRTEVRLSASATGFGEEVRWLRPPDDAGAALEVEVRLRPAGVIRGFVRSPEGAPLGYASVTAWNPAAEWWKRPQKTESGWVVNVWTPARLGTVTEQDGSFAIEGVDRGAVYGVSAHRHNTIYTGNPKSIVVPDSGDAVVDLVLGEPGSIRFDWGGREPPVSPCTLRLFSDPPLDSPPAVEYWGDFRQRGRNPVSVAAPAGTWRVSLTLNGQELLPQEKFTVVSGKETVVVVSPGKEWIAASPTAVSGVLVDRAGRGIPSIGIAIAKAESASLDPSEHVPLWGVGPTDQNGTFAGTERSGQFGPGSMVLVVANAPGHGTAVIGPLPLPVEGARLVLPGRGELRGRVIVPPSPIAPQNLVLLFRPAEETLACRVTWPREPEFRRMAAFRDGSFLLEDLPVGRGSLTIRTEAGSAGPIAVDVAAGEVLDLGTIEMPAGRTVQGRIVDVDGVPVPHASVRIEGVGPILSEARTSADGAFVLHGVAEGDTIRAAAVGYFPSRAPAADGGAMTLVLRRGGIVVGTARDGRGRPAAGAWIRALPRDGGDAALAGVDARGRFEISLGPGLHDLELQPPDRGPPVGRAEVLVEDGRTVPVAIQSHQR